MSFESEAQMKEVAKENILRLAGNPPDVVMDEFPYGAGRTDLVYAKVSYDAIEKRLKELGLAESLLDYIKEFLLLHKRKPVSVDYYLDLGVNKQRTKRKRKKALRWLKSKEYVVETEDGKIRTQPGLKRHITTSTAVELKLTKWKDALNQANRAKVFSNYQFVILDENNADQAICNLDVFKKDNVGLATLTPSGKLSIKHEPERMRPLSKKIMWYLNENSLEIHQSRDNQTRVGDFHG